MVGVRKVRGRKAPTAVPVPRPAVRKALAFSPAPVATVSPASDEDVVTAASTTFSSAVSAGNLQEVLSSESEKEEVGRSASSLGCSSPPAASTIIATEIRSSSTSTSADAAVDTDLLMRACSAVASSSTDRPSGKVAAAFLKALEHEAAVARGDGRLDSLSNRVEKVWIAVLCFGVLSILSALAMFASWSCLDEDWSPYPPPT